MSGWVGLQPSRQQQSTCTQWPARRKDGKKRAAAEEERKELRAEKKSRKKQAIMRLGGLSFLTQKHRHKSPPHKALSFGSEGCCVMNLWAWGSTAVSGWVMWVPVFSGCKCQRLQAAATVA